MYFTQDVMRYIVKSLSAEESETLREIAGDYCSTTLDEESPESSVYQVISKRKGLWSHCFPMVRSLLFVSLCLGFFDCHAIHFSQHNKTFYFVVMANIFDPAVSIQAR